MKNYPFFLQFGNETARLLCGHADALIREPKLWNIHKKENPDCYRSASANSPTVESFVFLAFRLGSVHLWVCWSVTFTLTRAVRTVTAGFTTDRRDHTTATQCLMRASRGSLSAVNSTISDQLKKKYFTRPSVI